MKKTNYIFLLSICSLLFILAPVGIQAQRPWPPAGMRSPLHYPKFDLGIGSHTHNYESDERRDNWGGYALRGSVYLNEHLAGRMKYYNIDARIVDFWGDERGTSDISGLSIAALAGLNWEKGFNLFGGLGLYREDFDWMDYSTSWTGYTINYGIGYRWDIISLELSGEFRDPSGIKDFYEDELGVTGDSSEIYSSTSLAIGFGF